MAQGLERRTWIADPAWLGVPGGDEYTPTVTFDNGTVSGLTGCNRYSGTYTVSDHDLSFGPIRTTLLSCGPTAAAVEADFLDRLQRVATYSVEGDMLVLGDEFEMDLLAFDAMRATVEGSWEIIGYLMASGHGFAGTLADTQPTAVFDADGTVSGSTGCNSFRGKYTIEGTSIKVGPLLTTRMACQPDVAEQEAGIVQALQAATSFLIVHGTATLVNAEGQLVISLNAA
jgi:heat shock protein HslJ